jgi:hypothetical protein
MMRCAHWCLDVANIGMLMALGFLGAVAIIALALGKL